MTDEQLIKNILPEEVSNITFQELRELENRCGSKRYGELLVGETNSNRRREFHRENKNRPREMSSKIPPFKNLQKAIEKTAEARKPRDPRFHSSYGTFDPKIFEENYKFLDDIKTKEKKILRKKLKNSEINEEEKREIQKRLQKMENQTKEEFRKVEESRVKIEEREYEIQQLKQGRKPEFGKKSDEKLLNLVRKFETMKEKGGLQKHLKRRRKKNIQKDRKKLNLLNII